MAEKADRRGLIFAVPAGFLAVVGLYLSSFYSYLLFHSIVEMFATVVAAGIFMLAWNSRRILSGQYLLYVGIAFLFVGVLELAHTLSYKGMNVFLGYDANLPTQLWIAARYLQSFSFLTAPLFAARKANHNMILALYLLITTLLIGSIFVWKSFPDCFIEGKGLTPFKIASEYVISFSLVASLGVLYAKRDSFSEDVLKFIGPALLLAIASELAFTRYVSVYDSANLLGHVLMAGSFYLIYRAVIVIGITRPYDLVFRDLKHKEEVLRGAKEDLETRVRERTAELGDLNEELERELRERRQTEEELRASREQLRNLSSHLQVRMEEERAKIAREIHDELGQMLTALKMDLYLLRDKNRDDEIIEEKIQSMSGLLEATLNSVKRICAELRPGILDDLGLVSAIEWQAGEFQKRTNICCKVVFGNDELLAGKEQATALFRIFQEALTNVLRHAEATDVAVYLEEKDGNVTMIVEDNGKGISKEDLSKPRSFGLLGMRERARALGGDVQVEGGPGGGTKLKVNIPLR